MAEIKCIDVSEWQGSVNWKKVKAAGYTCAILRAGFGRSETQKDAEFDTNYKNAKAAGVKLGVYWYSYAVDKADAVKEAKACLKVIKGKSFELPVFYDMEENSMKSLGKTALTAMAKAFCEEIKKGGFRAGVYGNPDWFTNYLDYKTLKKTYPIWLAQYYKEAQMECDIWQYSSGGSVNGISGNVDLNIIYSADIVESADKAESTKVNYETAGLQTLLLTAYSLGLVKKKASVDNKMGDSTKTALLQLKKKLGLKEDSTLTLDFYKKAYKAIKGAIPLAGDANKDGVVDIKDATAIQKKLAGVEE